MLLQEGQMLETEENKFVLVRADKCSNELIAVDMDILSDVLLPDSPETVIDISNLRSEDLSKTSTMELELLNSPYLSETESSSDVINSIRNDLLDDVIGSVSDVSLVSQMTPNSCLLDISNFTAKDYFSSQNFDLDSNFQNVLNQEWKIVKLPLQVERGHEIIVFEPLSPRAIEAKAVQSSSSDPNPPEIERRMPKFNKRTKFLSDLREFERQLIDVSIACIDTRHSDRMRKQNFTSLKVDLDIEFFDDDSGSERKIKVKSVRSSVIKKKKTIENDEKPEETSINEMKTLSYVQFSAEKPLYAMNCEDDETDDDCLITETPKNVSLRCTYCQKMFITSLGLNNHIKNCPKFNEKMCEIIENGCFQRQMTEKNATPPLAPSEKNTTTSEKSLDNESPEDIVTTPVRKCPGRPKKRLFESKFEFESIRRSKRLCK